MVTRFRTASETWYSDAPQWTTAPSKPEIFTRPDFSDLQQRVIKDFEGTTISDLKGQMFMKEYSSSGKRISKRVFEISHPTSRCPSLVRISESRHFPSSPDELHGKTVFSPSKRLRSTIFSVNLTCRSPKIP